MHSDCGCGGRSAVICALGSFAFRPSSTRRSRCSLRVPCRADAGPHSSSIGLCVDRTVGNLSQTRECRMARAPDLSCRIGRRTHRLRNEHLLRRRMGGALCSFVLQQPLPLLALSRVAIYAPRRLSAGKTVDVAGDHRATGNCDDATGHGSILRDWSPHASHAESILRLRLLDRLLHQHDCHRTLASFKRQSLAPKRLRYSSVDLLSTNP